MITATEPLIAIAGATGLVGREALSILAERGHPASRIIAFASERSDGAAIAYGSGALRATPLRHPEQACIADAMICCMPADAARSIVPTVAGSGTVVVDNSSAFRHSGGVPLVIPEINGDLLETSTAPTIIANPNCSTILLLLALEPIRREFGINKAVVSTYQAISGAGAPALEELRAQAASHASDKATDPRFFPEPCALNVFSHESATDPETGINGEEQKMVSEAEKIWPTTACQIIPTCVRVPVERAHSQSVLVQLDREAGLPGIRDAITRFPGLALLDDREHAIFPTPLRASHRDEVLVGRLRFPNPANKRELALWICGDQLRKGAALNAVQILNKSLHGPHPRNPPGLKPADSEARV